MWKTLVQALSSLGQQKATAPDLRNVSIQSVNALAKHAENPRWDAVTGSVYWIDMPAGTLHRFTISTGESRSWKLADELCALVLGTDGRALVAAKDELRWFDPEKESQELWRVMPNHDTKTRRFNDAAWAPDGSLWLISMTLDGASPNGSLFRVTPEDIEVIAKDLIIGNGPAIDATNGRAYYADSHKRAVQSIDMKSGAHSPFTTFRKSDGYPDGMCVDPNGNLWIAHYDGAVVSCWNRNGERINNLRLPGHCPTAIELIPGEGNEIAAAITTTSLRNMKGGLLLARWSANFDQA